MNVSSEEDSIAENVNTPSVVADMVSILEALGEWRENEAKRILSLKHSAESQAVILSPETIEQHDSEILSRTMWQKGAEKLLYWGFSYGTVLGATFAAIEPQRVGRLVIDGNVNLVDYYETQLSATSISDTDLVSVPNIKSSTFHMWFLTFE